MNHKSISVWAHCMVKNEAKWLWYSVNSVAPFVDKVLLWDTGSRDASPEIEFELVKKYKDKIILKERKQDTPQEFRNVRHEMLDATDADWFLVVDGDEIWWEDSIKAVVAQLRQGFVGSADALIVPTINLVGDIFHYQDESSGNYKFEKYKGHYNLRAVKRNIPGLHSQGVHGVWGWADDKGKQIQDRNLWKFVNAPYLHATSVERSDRDRDVAKRRKKLKYEIGDNFPLDFYYPEVLFQPRPDIVPSPWETMSNKFKFRSFIETPFRKLKRKLFKNKIGY